MKKHQKRSDFTKAQMIRRYSSLSANVLAKKVGVSVNYVYKVRSDLAKKVASAEGSRRTAEDRVTRAVCVAPRGFAPAPSRVAEVRVSQDLDLMATLPDGGLTIRPSLTGDCA
jgi:hypothetical protein